MKCQSHVTTGRSRGGFARPAAALVLGLLPVANAQAATVTVLGSDGSIITEYRWTIEEDRTYHVQPDATPDPFTLAVRFHQSYMPVVASGETFVNPDDPNSVASSPDDVVLDPANHYFLSILPRSGYQVGGAPIAPGQGAVSVTCNQLPVPTAQISVLAFEDNQPLNGAPDVIEKGLAGFSVIVSDQAGQMSQDTFGNPLGTTYNPDGTVKQLGDGTITTAADGTALVQNLAPGKYAVQVVPPPGTDWSQTATIEGSKTIDAWVASNEPPYFLEFGYPMPHAFVGFVDGNCGNGSCSIRSLNGSATITGYVIGIHNDGPPYYSLQGGGPFPHTTPWIGLNDTNNQARYASRANPDGTFSIPKVPKGTYQLVVWDEFLDIIIAYRVVNVTQNGTLNIGAMQVNNWFAGLHGFVYEDKNENAMWEPSLGEVGIAGQAMNTRFRDGSIHRSLPTNPDGYVRFAEIFPFFHWQIAEVDFAKFKPTGLTVVVDGGGKPNPADPWPQQVGIPSPYAAQLAAETKPQPQPENGNQPFRTELANPIHPAAALLEGFQAFAGQNSVLLWGKSAYPPGDADNFPFCQSWNDDATCADAGFPGAEDVNWDLNADGTFDDDPSTASIRPNTFDPANGGIAGIVHYSVTRAEDDARLAAAEDWEAGVPGVTFRLWNSDRTQLFYEVASDSWDDNVPSGCPPHENPPFELLGNIPDCYDGLRNWNQLRVAVFDGGYGFDSRFLRPDGSGGLDPTTCGDGVCDPYSDAVEVPGMPGADYVVEMIVPPGYESQKEEDKNVDFGDEYVPRPELEGTPPILLPLCVGDVRTVPEFLTLFPGVPVNTTFLTDVDPVTPGLQMNLCDRKLVTVRDGQNAAADFFLFTKAPVAGHISGIITDDLQNDPNLASPGHGEKFGPPFMPVSIRDWTGREIARTYGDQYGRYNALVPSTYTVNPPIPTGVSPGMHAICLNDPTMPDPNDPTQRIPDPHHLRAYGVACLNFDFWPGKTTYLDTPVVPIRAFAGPNQQPVDCEFEDATPVISEVTGPEHPGPYIPYAPGADRTLTIKSMGPTEVPNPKYVIGGTEPPTIIRDYGFGPRPASCAPSPGFPGCVTIGGAFIPDANITWTDATITAVVPAGFTTGQLIVTGANGLSTPIGVMVTIGQSAADNLQVKTVNAGGSIQAAINAASPDDLILVEAGTYEELVVMWKPVRLQGAGAASTYIQAQKTGPKYSAWRAELDLRIQQGDVDLLPGQTSIGILDGEGPGILALGKNAGPPIGFGLVGQRPNSRIDGFLISYAEAGGAVYVSSYADRLEISNNRLVSNIGFFGGGIRVGYPRLLVNGQPAYVDAHNDFLSMHHNQVIENSTQTEAQAGTVGGGIALYNGSDNYSVADNLVCGNFTLGQGAGIGHSGLNRESRIERNRVIFNESFFQQFTTSGGGIYIGGLAPKDGPLSPGSGSVTVNANLIQGNGATGGDGGAIRVHRANGRDLSGANKNQPQNWHQINIVNNMIVDNVAALAGAGISLQDAARIHIVHNTITRNDSLATAGDAFSNPNTSQNHPSGLVSRPHSAALKAALPAQVPPGFPTNYASKFSDPVLFNDIVWNNRSFFFTSTPCPNPPCPFAFVPVPSQDPTTQTYWDLGLLGAAPAELLHPEYCILTPGGIESGKYLGGTNDSGPLGFVGPEYFNAGPGANFLNDPIDAPIAFDEGGNFIRPLFGPLTLIDPQTSQRFGNYHITTASTAGPVPIILIELGSDFDAEPRPQGTPEKGADEIP